MTLVAHAVGVPPGAGRKPRFFATPAAFGRWLEANHAKRPELLVGYWKVATGRPSMTWAQSVEQALRFGWIDGVRRSLGPDAYTIRFTPRKAGSHWSLVNVRTARRLVAEGRMAPAGLAAFQRRSSRNMGKGAYAQRRPVPMPPDLLRRLRSDAKAWAGFAARPPWYRRTVAWWLADAKRPETRERRFAHVLATARDGLPVRGLDRKGEAAARAGSGTRRRPGPTPVRPTARTTRGRRLPKTARLP